MDLSKYSNSCKGRSMQPFEEGACGYGGEWGRDDVQNSCDQAPVRPSYNAGVRTLEASLNHFHVYEHFQKLEESLEDVKRNKKTKEEHEQCFKVFDKEVKKLSLNFHPDRVRNRCGSGQELENAQKLQFALNATRTVLEILTAAFLEDIGFDYKYEYFLKMDISLLVNENEINNQITRVLYKISMLSEIKRMHIVGEIRNFLVESQRSLKCYLGGNANDFKKYRDYALYHLRKNIEGYDKLEIECDELHKECRDEGDDNMSTVVLSIARQSSKQSLILRKLESVARLSVKGNFKIFPVNETMDNYYILPFVDYVNVLSMCSLILEDRFSWSFGALHANPTLEKERPLFSQACRLASSIYDQNRCRMITAKIIGIPLFSQVYNLASYICGQNQIRMIIGQIIGRHYREINMKDTKETFNYILRKIENDLLKEFSVDAYNEGKSNRMQLRGSLLGVMADVQEREKKLREWMNECKTESDENSKKYHLMKGERKETEIQFTESVFNRTQNRKQNLGEDIRKFRNGSEENRSKLDQTSKKEIKDMEKKFQESLEQNKRFFNKQIATHKSSFENDSGENKRKRVQNGKFDKNEEKFQENFDLIEKIRAEFTETFVASEQDLLESEIHDKRRKVNKVEKKGTAGFEGDLQKNLQVNKEMSERCSETKQNTTENEA